MNADALGGSPADRDEPARPTLDGGCGCRIVGPLGVGSLLADPPLVHKIVGGHVYAVAYCARHAAADDLIDALENILAGTVMDNRLSAQARRVIATATAPSNLGRAQ